MGERGQSSHIINIQVVGFVGSTRVYIINQREFSEYSAESGLNLETNTIFAGFVLDKFIVQTTTGMATRTQT